MKPIYKTLLSLAASTIALAACSPATSEPPPEAAEKASQKTIPEAVPDNFGKPWEPSPEAQKQIDTALNKFDHLPGWIARTTTDEMTDKAVITTSIEATEEVAVWLKSVKPTLILRCNGKKIDAYVITNTATQPEIGNYNQATVTIRFDDKKPYSVLADQSTDNEALFIPGPTGFVKKVMAADLMLFKFTPFNDSPKTVKFPIKNNRETLKELRAGCKI